MVRDDSRIAYTRFWAIDLNEANYKDSDNNRKNKSVLKALGYSGTLLKPLYLDGDLFRGYMVEHYGKSLDLFT